MDITNKSRKPLSVSLPAGKRLFLGPGQTGQVSEKALEYPPVVKLLEAGDIKVAEGRARPKGGGADKIRTSFAPHHGGSGAMRQSGDR